MKISEALRTIRLIMDISQEDLAKGASVSRGFISKLEGGQREPSLETIRAICKTLNIPVSMLFILTESNDPIMNPYSSFVFRDLWEIRSGNKNG